MLDRKTLLNLYFHPESLSANEKRAWVTKLKVVVYFFCQLMELLDSEEAVGSGDVPAQGRGKKRTVSVAAAAGKKWT